MKKSILICLAIWLLGGCHSNQEKKATSIFMQPAKDEPTLIKMGFQHPLADTATLLLPDSVRKNIKALGQIFNGDILARKIHDTDVAFTFAGQELLGVQILISHVDTAKLFPLLSALGFARMRQPGDPRQFFENRSANIAYEAYFSKDQAIFSSRTHVTDTPGKP